MLNFDFYNPTHIAFGQGRIADLATLVPADARVLILLGGESARKNGTLDEVRTALGSRQIAEFNGIEPNPSFETLMQAVEQVKKECKAFHPDKDSKEDDCFEVVANGVVLDKLKPKSKVIKSNNPIKISNHSDFPRNTRGGWKI